MRLYQADSVVVTGTQPVVAGAETVIAVTDLISNLPSNQNKGAGKLPNSRVHVRGNMVVAPGTGTLSLTAKLYRGKTAAGVLIGSATVTPTGDPAAPANAIMNIVIDASETPNEEAIPYVQYCLTVAMTGDAMPTGDGSVTLACIEAQVFGT